MHNPLLRNETSQLLIEHETAFWEDYLHNWRRRLITDYGRSIDSALDCSLELELGVAVYDMEMASDWLAWYHEFADQAEEEREADADKSVFDKFPASRARQLTIETQIKELQSNSVWREIIVPRAQAVMPKAFGRYDVDAALGLELAHSIVLRGLMTAASRLRKIYENSVRDFTQRLVDHACIFRLFLSHKYAATNLSIQQT